MTKEEQENRIINKLLEAFSILREIDGKSNELHLSITKNSTESFLIKAHNDAYKTEGVAPVLVNKTVSEEALKFKSVDIPSEPTIEATMMSFDKAMREVTKAAELYGNDFHVRTTKIALSTMKEVFRTQLLLDSQK